MFIPPDKKINSGYMGPKSGRKAPTYAIIHEKPGKSLWLHFNRLRKYNYGGFTAIIIG